MKLFPRPSQKIIYWHHDIFKRAVKTRTKPKNPFWWMIHWYNRFRWIRYTIAKPYNSIWIALIVALKDHP